MRIVQFLLIFLIAAAGAFMKYSNKAERSIARLEADQSEVVVAAEVSAEDSLIAEIQAGEEPKTGFAAIMAKLSGAFKKDESVEEVEEVKLNTAKRDLGRLSGHFKSVPTKD